MPYGRWVVFGNSVQGASHIRSGQPGQDDVFWMGPARKFPFAVLAVADGHGSAKAFRSDRGAQFATRSAVRCLEGFLLAQSDFSNLSAIKRIASDGLPQELVKGWVADVEQDLIESPLTLPELQTVEARDCKAAREAIEQTPLLAYGSTLLAVAVTEKFVLYLQIGDGDIVCVSDEGEPTRPIAHDDRLFANETTSLCAPQAWRDFRSHFQVISGRHPALVMLSTDGYSNSYKGEIDFLKVGPDMLEIIRSEGTRKIERCLPDWLAQTSQEGSGDDISLGLIVRADLSKDQEPFFNRIFKRVNRTGT